MTIPNLTVRWLLALAFAALLLPPLVSRSAAAHDIPDEILVNSFIKPDSGRLVAVTRIPLSLFEGMALPKRGPGYLDLARIEARSTDWCRP